MGKSWHFPLRIFVIENAWKDKTIFFSIKHKRVWFDRWIRTNMENFKSFWFSQPSLIESNNLIYFFQCSNLYFIFPGRTQNTPVLTRLLISSNHHHTVKWHFLLSQLLYSQCSVIFAMIRYNSAVSYSGSTFSALIKQIHTREEIQTFLSIEQNF